MSRTLDEIAQDPAASPEEVRRLSESDPVAAVRHPNCPPELWRELAMWRPMEAKENPTLLLYSLEDPALYSWEALELEFATRWVSMMLPTLSKKDRQLWAADCIERVLPFYERDYPNDPRLRHTISVRRARANGLATEEQWYEACSAVRSMLWEMEDGAARSAALVAIEDSTRDITWDIAQNAIGVPTLDSKRSRLVGQIRADERVWQWRQLLTYL